MTLLSLARELGDAVSATVTRRALRLKIGAAQTRQRQVSEAAILVRRVETSRRLVEQATGTRVLPSGVGKFGDRLAEFEAKYRADRQLIIAPDQALSDVLGDVRTIAMQAQLDLQTAWTSHVMKTTKVASADFMILDQVPKFRLVIAALRELNARAGQVANVLPTNSEDVRAAQTIATEFLAAWQGVEGVPVEVVRFLTGATQAAGAPLSELTEEVRRWLEANQLVSAIRVRINRSP